MAASGSIRAGKAFVEVGAVDKTQAALRNIKKRLQNFGSSIQAVGANLLRLGAVGAAPFAFAIKSASDLEETMNKFDVVFAENAGAVKAWGDEYAAQVGRSEQQVADFLAGTQDLFVPIGFDAAAAEAMSKQITSLAIDVASFNNKADADVLRDFHAALTGGGETVKKYGVLLNVATVNAELLRQGLDPKTATEQQKVQARLNILMQGTTAAQGDAIRSAGGFANQMKALEGAASDAASSVGSAILPAVTSLVSQFKDGVKFVREFAEENPAVFQQIAAGVGVALALGAALMGIGVAIKLIAVPFGLLASAIGAVTAVAGALLSPLGLIAAAVGGLGALFATQAGIGKSELTGLKDTASATFSGIAKAIAKGDIASAWSILTQGLATIWAQVVEMLKATWREFVDFFVDLGQVAVNKFVDIWQGAQAKISDTGTQIVNDLSGETERGKQLDAKLARKAAERGEVFRGSGSKTPNEFRDAAAKRNAQLEKDILERERERRRAKEEGERKIADELAKLRDLLDKLNQPDEAAEQKKQQAKDAAAGAGEEFSRMPRPGDGNIGETLSSAAKLAGQKSPVVKLEEIAQKQQELQARMERHLDRIERHTRDAGIEFA